MKSRKQQKHQQFWKTKEFRLINLLDQDSLGEFWLRQHVQDLNSRNTVVEGMTVLAYRIVQSLEPDIVPLVNNKIAEAILNGEEIAHFKLCTEPEVVDAIAKVLNAGDLPCAVEKAEISNEFYFSVYVGDLDKLKEEWRIKNG